MRNLHIVLGAVVVITLAGCANDRQPEPGSNGAGAEAARVLVSDSDLGQILTDGEGLTLYLFLQDSGTTSACEADCAATWPPLTVEGEPGAGAGANPSLLGTTARGGGANQVTYAGHPLYRYSGDQEVGDTNGEGLGGVWFAVSPTGDPVNEVKAGEGEGDGAGPGGGYYP